MALIKCSECGRMISDKALNCPQCGAPVEVKIQCAECGESIPDNCMVCPNCGCPVGEKVESRTNSYKTTESTQSSSTSGDINFGKAISICFQKFAQFSGRATKSEFWYFYLFCMLPGILGWLLKLALEEYYHLFGDYFYISIIIDVFILIINFILFIPVLSVSIRRLHDINKSGWNILWILLPFIGIIILLIFWLKGSDGDNQYGPSYMR